MLFAGKEDNFPQKRIAYKIKAAAIQIKIEASFNTNKWIEEGNNLVDFDQEET